MEEYRASKSKANEGYGEGTWKEPSEKSVFGTGAYCLDQPTYSTSDGDQVWAFLFDWQGYQSVLGLLIESCNPRVWESPPVLPPRMVTSTVQHSVIPKMSCLRRI